MVMYRDVWLFMGVYGGVERYMVMCRVYGDV